MKNKSKTNFNNLVEVIQEVHSKLSEQASKAVNVSLTIRNWCIGYYIVEYELHGADHANYGEKLLPELAKKLKHLRAIHLSWDRTYTINLIGGFLIILLIVIIIRIRGDYDYE